MFNAIEPCKKLFHLYVTVWTKLKNSIAWSTIMFSDRCKRSIPSQSPLLLLGSKGRPNIRHFQNTRIVPKKKKKILVFTEMSTRFRTWRSWSAALRVTYEIRQVRIQNKLLVFEVGGGGGVIKLLRDELKKMGHILHHW